MKVPEDCRQLLLVTTENWDASAGLLQRFSLGEEGEWSAEEDPFPVVVGSSGLAWGRGLHPPDRTGVKKREGDGKSPAGVFDLGTAFGEALDPPIGVRFPYRQVGEHDFFVDDVASADYNQWVYHESDRTTRWQSYERMDRDDHLYELGIVVRHNPEPVEPGSGSAIFLHRWREPGHPTTGCTAMASANLKSLLGWLDPEKCPLFVQIPESSFFFLEEAPHLLSRRGKPENKVE